MGVVNHSGAECSTRWVPRCRGFPAGTALSLPDFDSMTLRDHLTRPRSGAAPRADPDLVRRPDRPIGSTIRLPRPGWPGATPARAVWRQTCQVSAVRAAENLVHSHGSPSPLRCRGVEVPDA